MSHESQQGAGPWHIRVTLALNTHWLNISHLAQQPHLITFTWRNAHSQKCTPIQGHACIQRHIRGACPQRNACANIPVSSPPPHTHTRTLTSTHTNTHTHTVMKHANKDTNTHTYSAVTRHTQNDTRAKDQPICVHAHNHSGKGKWSRKQCSKS